MQVTILKVRMAKLVICLILHLCVVSRPCSADSPAPVPATATTAPQVFRSSVFEIEVLARQTCEGLGACQGAAIHDGFIYLYGDLYEKDRQSGPGVIRQYSIVRTKQGVPQLVDSGLEIRLTRRGENLINHPTGLTWNPSYGTYLGDTVTKTKRGTIYHINWTQKLIDRNLDNAILNVIHDDLAIQGCRPEFVRRDDRWLLATADYGQIKNSVRLYDPALLASCKSTSADSVLVEEFPCGPFVQQLHWIDDAGLLILAQNQIEGRRWRLTPTYPWKSGDQSDLRSIPPYDALPDLTELEGFTVIDREYCLLVSSSRKDNVTIARMKMPHRQVLKPGAH